MMEVIKDNERLIYSVINKYKRYFDKDDLFQVGCIGIIKAYRNYNNSSNTKFSSYAYFYIVGEINSYIRESNFFKVSKDLSRLNKKINDTKVLLEQKYGREVSDDEIASFLEIDLKLLCSAKISQVLVESLDKEENDFCLYEKVGYKDQNIDPEYLDLKEELSKLDDFSKGILQRRYMMGESQKEISEELGITQVMASRKEKEILEKLRVRLR